VTAIISGTAIVAFPQRHGDRRLAVYFADPRGPWQRGTNENTNRLLRQYLPEGVSMAGLTQDDLDQIAARLNTDPARPSSSIPQPIDWPHCCADGLSPARVSSRRSSTADRGDDRLHRPAPGSRGSSRSAGCCRSPRPPTTTRAGGRARPAGAAPGGASTRSSTPPWSGSTGSTDGGFAKS
jgi:hypothetical protein